MAMKLVILVYVVLAYQMCFILNDDLDTDYQKFIQCKVCQEMFVRDFDYDKLLKDRQIMEDIKKVIQSNFEKKITFENIEAVAKEVSMQYFFKGGDSQFEGEIPTDINFNSCKVNKLNNTCEILKKKLCESILSLESGTCNKFENYNFRFKLKNKILVDENGDNKKINFLDTNGLDNLQNLVSVDSKKTKLSPLETGIESINKSEISFVEVAPEYINQNFESKTNNHWNPPKPILLQNFENSMGNQLKEISFLTSEIAKYEKKLGELKQQLANKLEIAQSSYNVIQKTLQQISQMVNKPNLPDVIKSPSQFTEDDWDESAKPKFLAK